MKKVIIGTLIWAYATTSWIVNIIQFIGCDFSPIGKLEIIKGVGTFVPPTSMITVWF